MTDAAEMDEFEKFERWLIASHPDVRLTTRQSEWVRWSLNLGIGQTWHGGRLSGHTFAENLLLEYLQS